MASHLEPQIASLGHGDHLCALYRNAEQFMGYLVPYTKQGLARGERCCYVVNGAADQQLLLSALQAEGIDVQEAIRMGSLRLFTPREIYLPGGSFHPDAILALLDTLIDETIAAGFSGFRGAAEMSWVLDAEVEEEQLNRYEALLNNSLPGRPALTLCLYDLNRFTDQAIRNALRTHPLAIGNGHVYSNLFYEPPHLILDNVDEAERVDWMLQQLDKGQKALLSMETANDLLKKEIVSHQQTQQTLARQNRLLDLLSGVNEGLFTVRDRGELFEEACRIAVETGGFRMAWVGVLDSTTSRIVPAASWGMVARYLQHIHSAAREQRPERGPSGRAFVENTRIVYNDIEHDVLILPWRQAAIERGYRSVAAFPLRLDGRAEAVLTVYATEVGFFDDAETRLLDRLAADISRTMQSLEGEESRRLAHEALKRSEERYRELTDTLPEIVFETDLTGRVSFASGSGFSSLGYSLEELVLTPSVLNVVYPDDREKARINLGMALSGIDVLPTEYRVLRKDGTSFPAMVYTKTTYGNGVPTGLRGVLADISHQKAAEEAVRASDEMLRNVFAASPDAIVVSDLQARILDCNQAALDIHGVSSKDEMQGKLSFDLIVPEERERAINNAMLVLRDGTVKNVQYRVISHDGSELMVEMTVNVLRDRQREPIGFVAVVKDITQRVNSEAVLRETTLALQAIVEASPLPILTMDTSGVVTSWNPAAERVFGWSAAEAIGVRPIMVPENRQHELDRLLHNALSGIPARGFETRRQRKDGSEIDVSIWTSPITGANGEIKGMMSILSDITQQKQLQEQLLRAQRLETAGRIAGQVAHDFNNLLGPMAAYPELIKMGLPPGHKSIKLCDDMLLAAQSMADINTDLLALSRRGILNYAVVNVNDVIRQTIDGLQSSLNGVSLVTNLADDLFPVRGSLAQLLRVIDNLVRNACDAMHGVGVLTVTTENVYLDSAVGQYNRVEMGEYCKVAVTDTGGGIAPEIRDKIFDAFFTTKPTSGRRGSGLGLTVVEALVEDHRGYVDVESELGKGSTFSVYLPAYREVVQQNQAIPVEGGHETVLVVDDDPLQRQVTQKILMALGYTVEVVESGEAAVAWIKEQPVELLILDMVMPNGIDGVETYRRISAIRPGQRAIVLSGFAETERVREAQRLGAGAYVRKPVSIEKLARTVREELSRPGR